MAGWKRWLKGLGASVAQSAVEDSPAADIIEAVTGTAGTAGIDTFVITYPTKDKVAITIMVSKEDFDAALKGRLSTKTSNKTARSARKGA